MKTIEWNFKVINNKLSFTSSTQGSTFQEVREGLILLKDEVQRQLDNETKCPFYSIKGVISQQKIKKTNENI